MKNKIAIALLSGFYFSISAISAQVPENVDNPKSPSSTTTQKLPQAEQQGPTKVDTETPQNKQPRTKKMPRPQGGTPPADGAKTRPQGKPQGERPEGRPHGERRERDGEHAEGQHSENHGDKAKSQRGENGKGKKMEHGKGKMKGKKGKEHDDDDNHEEHHNRKEKKGDN